MHSSNRIADRPKVTKSARIKFFEDIQRIFRLKANRLISSRKLSGDSFVLSELYITVFLFEQLCFDTWDSSSANIVLIFCDT